MMLLQAELLAFLAALGVPLLLHLLELRRRKPQDLPTLRFLKEIERSRLKSLKLRRWLLLLLRLLLVAALVLAFVRPLLQRAWLPTAAERDHLFLLDDSASMREANPSGKRVWDLAQGEARELLAEMPEAARVWIASLSHPEALLGPLSPEAAGSELASMPPTWAAARPEQCLSNLKLALDSESPRSMDLHLFSDLRLEPFPIPEDLVALPGNRAILHEYSVTNAGPGLLSADPKIKDQNLELNIGWQGDARESARLDFESAGHSLARTLLRGQASVGGHTSLHLPLKEKGWLSGYLRLQGEPAWRAELPLALHLPVQADIGLFCQNQELDHVMRAALQPGGEVHSHRLESYRAEVLPAEWPDLFVLAVGKELGSHWMSWLKNALRQGCSLLVLPEPELDAGLFNRLLENLELSACRARTQAEGGLFRLDHWDLEHAMFAGLLKQGGQMEHLALDHLYDLEPHKLRVLASAGRSPFLLAGDTDRGRVMLLAASPLARESSFAHSGLFAPLIQGALAWLAGDVTSGPEFECGLESHMAQPAGFEDAESWLLERGEQNWQLGATGRLAIPALREPGIYELKAAGERVALCTARVPRQEIESRPSSANEWLDAEDGIGWQLSTDELADAGDGLFHFSPWLLALALVLMLLESLLATGRRTHESEL